MGSSSSTGSRSRQSSVASTVVEPKQNVRVQHRPKRETLLHNGTPIPVPPLIKKTDVLVGYRFEILDEIALQVPLELLLGTFWDVVEYLVVTPEGDVLDDISKARMFFRWMTSFDPYTIETEIIPPEGSPLEYFMKIQYDLGDHAHMFYSLCQMADIPCLVINGMTKGGGYEIGDAVDREKMQAKWNAVIVGGEWRFVDTFWASVTAPGPKSTDFIFVDTRGNVTRVSEDKNKNPEFSVNEFFFLCDPEHLIFTHFPDDKDWQLLHDPLDIKEFENKVYVREQYHNLGMSILADSDLDNCMLKTQDEAIKIVLDIPQKISGSVKFKYALVQTRKQVETEKEVDIVFERFVRMEHTQHKVKLKLRFPITGRFLFDLYAADMRSTCRYELVCSYLIVCSKQTKNHNPFPDCPVLGWGPNPYSDMAGLIPIVPQGTSIQTANGICQICVGRRGITGINHTLRNVLMDEAILTKHAVGKFEEEKYIVDLALPEEGEYALKIFATTKRNLSIQTTDLLTYLVKYQIPTGKRSKNSPFPMMAGAHLGKKDKYSQMGVKALTYKSDHVEILEGEGSFIFKADLNVQLLCELSSASKEAQSRLSVNTKQEGDRWIFEIDVPIPGSYSLNIFAIDDGYPMVLHNVYTYSISSNGRPIKEVKFTDDFGPEDIIIETIKTSEEKVQIAIPSQLEDEVLYAIIHRRDAVKNEGGGAATVQINKSNIDVLLESDGEYMLDIYEQDQEHSVVTIARFTISKGKTFKTYSNDMEALVNMLKPQDKSKRVKKALEHRRQRKTLAKKKMEESKRKENEENKRKEDELRKKEMDNIKSKMTIKDVDQNIEDKTDIRTVSPDTFAAALAIAQAAESDERKKQKYNKNKEIEQFHEMPSNSSDKSNVERSQENLSAALAVLNTIQSNSGSQKGSVTNVENRTGEENTDVSYSKEIVEAAISVITAVETDSLKTTKSKGGDLDISPATLATARSIVNASSNSMMMEGKRKPEGSTEHKTSHEIQNKNKANGHTNMEVLAAAVSVIKASEMKNIKMDNTEGDTENDIHISEEALVSAIAIVEEAKCNGDMDSQLNIKGKCTTESSMSPKKVNDAVAVVIANQSSNKSSINNTNIERVARINDEKESKRGNEEQKQNSINPETLAAAVALVVASKKHDEETKQRKLSSSKRQTSKVQTKTDKKIKDKSVVLKEGVDKKSTNMQEDKDRGNKNDSQQKQCFEDGHIKNSKGDSIENTRHDILNENQNRKGSTAENREDKGKDNNSERELDTENHITSDSAIVGTSNTNFHQETVDPKTSVVASDITDAGKQKGTSYNTSKSRSKRDTDNNFIHCTSIADPDALAAAVAIITSSQNENHTSSIDTEGVPPSVISASTLETAKSIIEASKRRDKKESVQGHLPKASPAAEDGKSSSKSSKGEMKKSSIRKKGQPQSTKGVPKSKENKHNLSQTGHVADDMSDRSVSPNTLAAALAIVSAAESNVRSDYVDSIRNETKDSVHKPQTVQTANGKTSKVTNIPTLGAENKNKNLTSKTPKLNLKSMKKDTPKTITAECNDSVDDENYRSDSTIHPSDLDSCSDSEYDSEEERAILEEHRRSEALEKRKSVAKAMKKKDLKDLVFQLQEFKKSNDAKNEALVQEATKMITQLRAKEDLAMACNIREAPALQRAIRKAKKVNYGKELDIQIILASRVLQRLTRIERLSQTVLQINQNALVEMKKYQTPPPGVHESLTATFLILGEDPAPLKTWKSCQALLFKTGRESIMRRISEFNPKIVSKDVAATAKKIIAPYSVLQIRDASLGASAFYVWAKGMIGEVEIMGRSIPKPRKERSTRQLPPRSTAPFDDEINREETIIMRM